METSIWESVKSIVDHIQKLDEKVMTVCFDMIQLRDSVQKILQILDAMESRARSAGGMFLNVAQTNTVPKDCPPLPAQQKASSVEGRLQSSPMLGGSTEVRIVNAHGRDYAKSIEEEEEELRPIRNEGNQLHSTPVSHFEEMSHKSMDKFQQEHMDRRTRNIVGDSSSRAVARDTLSGFGQADSMCWETQIRATQAVGNSSTHREMWHGSETQDMQALYSRSSLHRMHEDTQNEVHSDLEAQQGLPIPGSTSTTQSKSAQGAMSKHWTLYKDLLPQEDEETFPREAAASWASKKLKTNPRTEVSSSTPREHLANITNVIPTRCLNFDIPSPYGHPVGTWNIDATNRSASKRGVINTNIVASSTDHNEITRSWRKARGQLPSLQPRFHNWVSH